MTGTRRRAAVAAPEPRLGHLTVSQFLRRHWQRRPLLMRQALQGLTPDRATLFSTRELFAMAGDPDVESRLVLSPAAPAARARGTSPPPAARWQLRHGPFKRLPPRRQAGWSLLVQGVDLHLQSARTLMERFRFIPDARLDDLMVSFATDGGGVGPHVDSYDVFLLQVQGRRRWSISAPPAAAALVADAPLRILANFRADQTWLLEPGDMLYLPPGWGHEGTAVGDCMTCSIGFRSPSIAELRQAFFSFLAEQGPQAAPAREQDRRYRDRTLKPARHPAEIPADMADTLAGWLRRYRPPAPEIERFIGCYLTEPKPSVWFDAPQKPGCAAGADPAVVLDRRSRMLYRHDVFYINGEAVRLPRSAGPARRLLRALADQRCLDAVQTASALRLPWLRDRLEAWLTIGWLRRAGS